MLNGRRNHTTLPAMDLARAKAFYSEKLGLEPTSELPGGNMYETAGGTFVLFPGSTPSAGAFTQMGFTVDDIEAEVADLKSRGVEFETYGMPNFDADTSIFSPGPVRSAWFKDSEGNLIGLVQFMTGDS
jgi:predicted enzyme related to lactoylglutathione lyase